MTEKIYELFKKTNPRLRKYERDKKARVLVGATCSVENKESFEKLAEVCKKSNDVIVEKITETDTIIYFTVTSNLDFTDMLIRDFLN